MPAITGGPDFSVSRALRRATAGPSTRCAALRMIAARMGYPAIPGLKSETWGTLSSWLSKSWGLRDPPHRGLREDSESADQILRVVWSRRFQIGKGEV